MASDVFSGDALDFELSEDQQLIQDAIRKFVSDAYPHDRWQQVRELGGFDRNNWRALAEIGCLAIGLPASVGGIGGIVEIAIASEELGRGLVLEPVTGSAVFAAQTIASAGLTPARQEQLSKMVAGDIVAAVAYSEPATRGGLDGIQTTAMREGGGYLLNGRKSLVIGGAVADLMIIAATLPGSGALSLFTVARSTDGMSVISAPHLDGAAHAQVTLNNVRVSSDALLGREGEGRDVLIRSMNLAILSSCAEAVGIIDKVIELTIDYLRARRQFGVPIASMQAVRHKVADLVIDQETAHGALNQLIASLQSSPDDRTLRGASAAKALIGSIGRRVSAVAIQLHGAMGMTSECAVGRFYARMNVLDTLYGQGARHLETYSNLLASEILHGDRNHERH